MEEVEARAASSALNRMLKRAMSAAWEEWQQVYADQKFANRMGGGAIRRMLNRGLSAAWEKWQFTAAEMARQQFLLAGALSRMLKRAMSAAWEECTAKTRLRQGVAAATALRNQRRLR